VSVGHVHWPWFGRRCHSWPTGTREVCDMMIVCYVDGIAPNRSVIVDECSLLFLDANTKVSFFVAIYLAENVVRLLSIIYSSSAAGVPRELDSITPCSSCPKSIVGCQGQSRTRKQLSRPRPFRLAVAVAVRQRKTVSRTEIVPHRPHPGCTVLKTHRNPTVLPPIDDQRCMRELTRRTASFVALVQSGSKKARVYKEGCQKRTSVILSLARRESVRQKLRKIRRRVHRHSKSTTGYLLD
jgi:hypothetical protein